MMSSNPAFFEIFLKNFALFAKKYTPAGMTSVYFDESNAN